MGTTIWVGGALPARLRCAFAEEDRGRFAEPALSRYGPRCGLSSHCRVATAGNVIEAFLGRPRCLDRSLPPTPQFPKKPPLAGAGEQIQPTPFVRRGHHQSRAGESRAIEFAYRTWVARPNFQHRPNE